MVTSTENNPRAIRSVTSSISVSVAFGSLSFSYVHRSGSGVCDGGKDGAAGAAMVEDEAVGVTREGAREKRDGDMTRKSRC